MSTELPTRTDLFVNALAALDSARSALSDARDWLRSDWEPVDTALPHEAARARAEMLGHARRCSPRSVRRRTSSTP